MKRHRQPGDDRQLVLFEEPPGRPTPLEEWRWEIDDWLDEPKHEDQTRIYVTS